MQNDMRDRLVELIKQAEIQESINFFNADLDEQIDMSGGTKISVSLECLADCLIANGVIVPPCKVGDTIYYIDTIFREIEKCKVYGFTIINGEQKLLVDNGQYKYVAFEWYNTKKEAEQKLKELRENA